MKVIFFGTSEFAAPALRALADMKNTAITAVITQPDKPAGRKREPLPSPVKVEAQKLGLKILQPSSLSSLPKTWGGIEGEVDLFIVASYGKIIPKEILELPKYGTLNIHPSLLPQYRGPSPIQAAILNGDRETGVTIMKLDEEMDHGPILASEKLNVKRKKFRELHDQLADMGAKLLIKTLPDYVAGKLKPKEQDHSKATYTKIITRNDARIDWSKSAEGIERMVRAYHSWPVAWTTLDGKGLKIYDASPVPSSGYGEGKGGVEINDGQIFIHCGPGLLQINELQLEGAKKMTAREFANGHPDLVRRVLK